MLKEGDCFGHRDIARGGVVEIVEEKGDLLVFEVCQQIDDLVDRRTRPVVCFGRHGGR
jgi:hypothetical protein